MPLLFAFVIKLHTPEYLTHVLALEFHPVMHRNHHRTILSQLLTNSGLVEVEDVKGSQLINQCFFL